MAGNTTTPLTAKLSATWRADLLSALDKRAKLQSANIRKLRGEIRSASSDWAEARETFDRENSAAAELVAQRTRELATAIEYADQANAELAAAEADPSVSPESVAKIRAAKVDAWMERADAEDELQDARDAMTGEDPGTIEEYMGRTVAAYEGGVNLLARVEAVRAEVLATGADKVEKGKVEVWAHVRELNLSDIRR